MPGEQTSEQLTPVSEAADSIYKSLTDENFSSQDKIDIIKQLSGLVKTELSEQIASLTRLRSSF